MNIKDKELINYFKEQNVEIDLFPECRKVKFSTIERFREYIIKECEFWDEIETGNAAIYKNRYNNILDRLNNAIIPSVDFSQSVNCLTDAINLSKDKLNTLYSDTEAAHKLKQLYLKSYLSADAFVDFIKNSSFTNLSNINYFFGAIQTLNFFNQTNNSEIIIAKENLISELTERFSNQIDSLDSQYVEEKCKIETDTKTFQEEMISWKEKTTVEFEDYLNNKKNILNNLENTYEENLRLKKPAEYWEKLYDDYILDGNKWRNWAVKTAILMIVLMIIIFFNLPAEFSGSIKDFKFETVRSILILAVIVSIGVYLLRIFVKLSLSSYHLARDAKERYELTYVYLSLINENAITEENRSIVLNALFCRADTGLLKGDSGPMMPESLVSQIAKLIK